MNKKRLLAIILTVAIICGGVVGVSAAVRRTTSGSGKVMVVQASELNYGSGYWDNESMDGYVTSDRTQNVTLNDAQTVDEVKVTEGQQVKKGDVLLVYDQKQTKINLEKANLNLELIQLSLKNAEEGLEKLKKMKPSSSGVGDDDGGGDIDDGDDDDDDDNDGGEKAIKPPKAASKLTGSTKAYYNTGSDAGEPGSEQNPYRFLVKSGATVTPDFINLVKKLQGQKANCYFVLELREKDSWTGRLIRAWMQDASDVLSVDKDWLGVIDPDNEKPIIPVKTSAEIDELVKQAEEHAKKIEELEKQLKDLTDQQPETPSEGTDSAEALQKKIAELEAANQALQAQLDAAGSGSPSGGEDSGDPSADEEKIEELETENANLQKQIDQLEADLDDAQQAAASSSVSSVSMKGMDTAEVAVVRTVRAVQYFSAIPGNGTVRRPAAVMTALTATEVDDDEDDDSSSGSSGSSSGSDSSDSDASGLDAIDPEVGYTSEELKEAIKQQEQSIKDLKLDVREAELKVKSAEKAVEEGSVKAVLDGVVTLVGDPDTAAVDGSVFIRVSGSSGVAIKGGIPERLLTSLTVGDQILVMSWSNGIQYTATITEISPYPDTSGMFDSGMSYNNSSYPFTAIVDEENAELENHDWVQISVDANTLADDDGFYLMRAFVLEDGNTAYVYKRGEDGLLHKQVVQLGKLSGDSYEIRSGLTDDDWVAFPYGKAVKEGAPTREGTFEELYNS